MVLLCFYVSYCNCVVVSWHGWFLFFFTCLEKAVLRDSGLSLVTSLIQLTPVISNSLISNNRWSRSENLVVAWTWTTGKTYYGKEEKLLLRSTFSSFPQYFQYTFIYISRVQLYICEIWLCELFFLQFCTSGMLRNGYLEVFQRVPWNLR